MKRKSKLQGFLMAGVVVLFLSLPLVGGTVYAQSPTVTFNPTSGTHLASGLGFDFTFIVNFGSTLELTAFSFSYQGIDMTDLFLAAVNSGFITASVQGSVVMVTIPGVYLPDGQHKVSIRIGSPGGTTGADWVVHSGSAVSADFCVD